MKQNEQLNMLIVFYNLGVLVVLATIFIQTESLWSFLLLLCLRRRLWVVTKEVYQIEE